MTAAQAAWRRLTIATVAVLALAGAATAMPANASPAPSGKGSAQSSEAIRLPSGKPALGQPWSPPAKAEKPANGGIVPGQVLVTFDGNTSVAGSPIPGMSALAARTPHTTSKALDARLKSEGASSVRPIFPRLPAPTARSLTTAARSRLGSGAVDLSKTFVVKVAAKDSAAAARRLSGTPGVAYAEPERYVNAMNTGAQPLPKPAATDRRAADPAVLLLTTAACTPSAGNEAGAAMAPASSLHRSRSARNSCVCGSTA
jgi:hypothetical protein